MDELRDLYQEVIFDHNRKPRNFHKLAGANRQAEGFNPLCGDQLSVYLKISDQDLIEDVSFEGRGCAISTASASIMTETLKGKTVQQANTLFENFHRLVTGQGADTAAPAADLGKLQVLTGVRDYPARVKCATLAWHTVQAALKNAAATVSTE
ncbi:MAG TPA: SUF system NifU family Fe-S cluster assembly protein [Burkholderiales bacterium]|nr:SUF system NifU family Fe-S cluster assembly protein [Burkholderiales bacterium]